MATQPIVGIIMGSDSDLPIMQQAADMLTLFNIPFELTVVSAHRTPARMVEYAKQAKGGDWRRPVSKVDAELTEEVSIYAI